MRSPYYININGEYGVGGYEKPAFVTLGELLENMDRLGIRQVVVHHRCARDVNAVYGNRLLMEDIERTPGAKDRVIPAFCAEATMMESAGEMEYLEAAFSSGQAHCLVLFPKTSRFRIVEIERVLERIRAYAPVVLIDVAELGDTKTEFNQQLQELERTASRFSALRFVIRKVAWSKFHAVLDLMTRVKNVYLDTSTLHTRDAIRIAADQAGYDRLVFGIGRRSHEGAAIAGLSYANVTQDQKDRIAWENFVRLFTDTTFRSWLAENRKTLPSQIKNSFWDTFADGGGVRNTLVIDMHSHIGPFSRSWVVPTNEAEEQLRLIEADMQKLGVDRICSQSEWELFGEPIKGNRILEAAVGERKGRFLGNLAINANYAELYTDEVLDGFYRGGYFRGMKLLPGYLHVEIGDERLAPVFRYADRHRLYILVHSWDEDGYGSPRQISEAALRYPNAKFVIAHTGGGDVGRRQCEHIAQDPRFANCYFEFCGSFCTDILWTDTLKKIDYRRVLFGTDTFLHDMAWEMGRLLSLDIPDEQLRAILGENMQKILDEAALETTAEA